MNDTLLSLYVLSSNTLTLWLLLLFLVFLKLWHSKTCKFLITFFFVTLWCYFICCSCDFSIVLSYLTTQNNNLTLQNGLLNIHPVFVYITYASICLFWIHYYFYYKINFYLNTTTSMIFTFFSTILIGIYLGAFWASQELNWGGFWSWDPVELVSLFLFFWFVLFMHNRNEKILNKPYNHIIIGVVIVYLIIRLGVVTTIHSFIRSNSYPHIVNLLLMWLSFTILWNAKSYYYTIKRNYTTRFLVAWWLIIFFIYIYTLTLIHKTNFNLLNPILSYYFITTLCVYVFIIYNGLNRTKFFIVHLFFFILVFVYNYLDVVSLKFFILFFCFFSTFKNIKLHSILLFAYVLFFIYFVNLSYYSTPKFNTLALNYNLSTTTNCDIVKEYYESFYFLKKQLFFNKIKNVWSHITGFSIASNYLNSLFIFSKNSSLYFLFTLDIVFSFTYYTLVIMLLNIFNYKYLKLINKSYIVSLQTY